MPSKRQKNKDKMFREFLYNGERKNNFLKNYRIVCKDVSKKYNITPPQLQFLIWGYDLEFFTISHAAEDNQYNYLHVEQRHIYSLLRDGFLYKYYDKLSPSAITDRQVFDENKYNYRVRYALTQKAKNAVKNVYKNLKISQ